MLLRQAGIRRSTRSRDNGGSVLEGVACDDVARPQLRSDQAHQGFPGPFGISVARLKVGAQDSLRAPAQDHHDSGEIAMKGAVRPHKVGLRPLVPLMPGGRRRLDGTKSKRTELGPKLQRRILPDGAQGSETTW